MAIGFPRLELLLTILNFGLLLALLLVFFKMWRQTKSAFSLGLSLFAGVLLLREVLALAQALDRTGRFPWLTLLANAGEAVALLILLYNVAR